MNINKTRGMLYLLARVLGDINAVKRGKTGERIVRRVTGRLTGKLLGKIFGK